MEGHKMDSCGKRLRIALTTVVITLGLNAVAVVSGLGEHTYRYLLGTETSARLEGAVERPSSPYLSAKVTTSKCDKMPHPKPARG
jgi:hypothetical protein